MPAESAADLERHVRRLLTDSPLLTLSERERLLKRLPELDLGQLRRLRWLLLRAVRLLPEPHSGCG